MAWFMRGVQSAVFHYASCAPCTGYMDSKRRRREAKLQRKARERLQLEDPEAYHHPEPTGTNPYWGEEIALGPGPPPRRARRTNAGSTRGMAMANAGTQSTMVSQGGSSIDGNHTDDMRLSDDTVDDMNWNRKRYQREDEDLWGLDEAPVAIHHTTTGSSATFSGFSVRRSATTSTSGGYYPVRAPPVNDLHPPVVSMPSPDPANNRWMLQPPPKASVMAGKERASNRSRSGSGTSSRVELGLQREQSLQRRVSARQMKQRLERRQTQELPSMTPHGSYTNLVASQRYERCKTPQARPPSSASSHRRRHDTAMTRTDTMTTQQSSTVSSDGAFGRSSPSHTAPIPDIKVIGVRQSRQILSTVLSSDSDRSPSPARHDSFPPTDENTLPEKPSPVHHPGDHARYSTPSPDPILCLAKPRAPLGSSDMSSLNVLQDVVSPRALVNSRFVSAPLVEAQIRLPPSDVEEMATLGQKQEWGDSKFDLSRGWGFDQENDGHVRVPFDSLASEKRDPTLRWSVDF